MSLNLKQKILNYLNEVKRILDENPEAQIVIEGHASTDGSEKFNQTLSLKRAEAVQAKLIDLGVDSSRLEVKSFGETMPFSAEDSAETRSKSRRVEFKAKNQVQFNYKNKKGVNVSSPLFLCCIFITDFLSLQLF